MTTDPPTAPARRRWPPDFEALYRQHYAPMVRLAYVLTRDDGVAEELVQDAFVRVHDRWGALDVPPAYLRTTVVNAARSWHRRRALRRREEQRVRIEPGADHHADELRDVLDALPDRQRTAIVLRFYEDLPDEEIAEILGCRPATVRTAIHRGLRRLRPLITEDDR